MDYSNILMIGLILAGAVILALSAGLTRKIFRLSLHKKFNSSWRNLSIMMICFFFAYLAAAYVVMEGHIEILGMLAGVIFLFGAVFVFMVVRAGLATFKALDTLNHGLEEKVRFRTQELEDKNKELERFAYVASHDLQEPLHTINSILKLVNAQCKERLDENTWQYMEYISKASGRMNDLIKGLLEFSRLGREKKLAPIDCNELVQDIRKDLAATIEQNNARLIIEKLPQLTGYPTEVRSLFQNLITNAIKYRKKDTDPSVEISAKQADGQWEIAVKDNGIGIPAEHKDTIFTIFKRLHTKQEYEGTGIGLALCQRIVELHGGRMRVDSMLDKGSTFYFTLPAA